MNIDFIKWKVEKADGFQMLYQEHEDRIQLPTGDQIGIDELEEDHWFKSIVDPLLTQRAIEGACDGVDITIIQLLDGICVETHKGLYTHQEWFYKKNYESIDNTKLSALRYVMEQESKS